MSDLILNASLSINGVPKVESHVQVRGFQKNCGSIYATSPRAGQRRLRSETQTFSDRESLGSVNSNEYGDFQKNFYDLLLKVKNAEYPMPFLPELLFAKGCLQDRH